MVRNILIGLYVLLVLGFAAKAKATEVGSRVNESSAKVSPFSP